MSAALIYLYLIFVNDGKAGEFMRVPFSNLAQCETARTALRVEKFPSGHGNSFALIAFCGPDKVQSTLRQEWRTIPEAK